MRTFPLLCLLGLLGSTLAISFAALTPQKNVLGKFMVTNVRGTATCVSEGRVLELKKGDAIVARGAAISTGPRSSAILVFSNGTGVYADENTQLTIERFDQEFFAPNNNLRVEPSNSATLAKVNLGRVVLSTPRLLSGSSMVYQTPHASVSIRGDKLMVEAAESRTHIAMLAGNATVNPRDATGNYAAIGKRLTSGQEAFVKYTLSQSDAASGEAGPEPGARGANSSPSLSIPVDGAPAQPAPAEESAQVLVLERSGTAMSRLRDALADSPLDEGSALHVGSLISTGTGATVLLQPHPGAVAALLPDSVLEIEQLTLAESKEEPRKRSVQFALRAGTLVSMLDPTRQALNAYAVRTLQGTARAQGTVFTTSVQSDGFAISSTADSVTFSTPNGTRYAIAAGTIVTARPGQDPQPPIPLTQAVAAKPALAKTVETALARVLALVQRNHGAFSRAGSANLLAQVTAAAASCMPNRAEEFASEAVSAIGTPGSALHEHPAAAIAAVLQAVVAGTPDRASPTAIAASQATLPHAAVIAASAAKSAPIRATQIAGAVSRVVLPSGNGTAVSPNSLDTVAAIGAAVAAVSPNHAAPVSVAVMQTVLDADPAAGPEINAQRGAMIAATVTRAAPGQAVDIARSMMALLYQAESAPTPQQAAQTGALLAGSIIAVVPPQAQPVATAVMLFIIERHPAEPAEWLGDVGGAMAAMLVHYLPELAQEIYAGIADALGHAPELLESLARRFQEEASLFASQAGLLLERSAAAFDRSGAALDALLEGMDLARVSGGNADAHGGTTIEINNSTSIVITQFDPTEVNQLTSDLEAAQGAQTSVQFYSEALSDGSNTVRPVPTIPDTLPVDLIVSPSTL